MLPKKRFWKLLVIPLSLFLMGEECRIAQRTAESLGVRYREYRYVDRYYSGTLYRQYYVQSTGARFITLHLDRDGWKIVRDRTLADEIQARKTESDEGTGTLPPILTSRANPGNGTHQAAATLIRRLYVLIWSDLSSPLV